MTRARVLPFPRPAQTPAPDPPPLTTERTPHGLSLTLRIDALDVARELARIEALKPKP